MSYYVYILVSELDQSYYIGQTDKLETRLHRHNRGYNKSTKHKRPWGIKWYFECETRSEAVGMERKLKNLKSRKKIEEFVVKMGFAGTEP
ncbi:GIY-YIG nuclease family protein [Bacteroidota bacterium]